MSSTTRSQTTAKYDRLKRSVSVVEPTTEVGRQLRDVASYILSMYPVMDDTGSPIPLSAGRKEEIENDLKGFLPSPESVLTPLFFKSPLFPVQLVRDVAALYDLDQVPAGIISSLHLESRETTNRSLVTHIWFMHFLDASFETMKTGVDFYRRSRSASRLGESLAIVQNNQETGENLTDILPPPMPHAEAAHLLPSNALPLEQIPLAQVPEPRRSHSGNDAGGQVDNPSSENARNTYNAEDTRKANYVSQHFKENRFSGELAQSIELTLRDYNVCARQHRLTPTQKADYFVNVLDGPARTFFFHNARDDMSFEQMAIMMTAEYNSNARQLQVYGILNTLRIDKVMTENELTTYSEGLTKVITMIEELSPQCPPAFRSEDHRIGFLRKAVLGIEWSKLPISNIVSSKYTFNGFITALRENLQLEEEIKEVARKTETHHIDEETLYQQYGRNPKFVRKHPPRNDNNPSPRHNRSHPLPRSFEESRRRNECHKCHAPWNPGHRCKPGSIRHHIRQRIKNGDPAVHIVSDLVLAMEGENEQPGEDVISADVNDDSNAEEVRLFDELTGTRDSDEPSNFEAVDQEWFTNHLSASMSKNDGNFPSSTPPDFH